MTAETIHPIACQAVSQRFGRIQALDAVDLLVGDPGGPLRILHRRRRPEATPGS